MKRECPLLSDALQEYVHYEARPLKKTVEIPHNDPRYPAYRQAAIEDGRDPDESSRVNWIEMSVIYFLVGFLKNENGWNAVWEPFISCDRPGGVIPNEKFRKMIAEALEITTDDVLMPIPDVRSAEIKTVQDGVVISQGYWSFA